MEDKKMAIMFEPKGGREVIEPSTKPDVLPLGQKPEGELNSLLRMQNAFNKLNSSNKLDSFNKLNLFNKLNSFNKVNPFNKVNSFSKLNSFN